MAFIWGALIIDFFLADPYWFPHPVRLIGKYISLFEKWARSTALFKARLKIAGVFLTITTIGLTFTSVWLILAAAKSINIILYWVMNILILWTCLAQRCLALEAGKVYKALLANDLPLARERLSYLVARDTSNLDEQGVVKGAVETVVENTSDGVIAPLFYMFLGGAPLAIAYKAVNTLDSMVGYKNDKYIDLGWCSAKVDDLANYIPARITGFFLIVAGFLLGYDYKKGWKIMRRDHDKHASINSAYPEAAAAGVLGIQLGGDNYYFGKLVSKPAIGDKTREIEKDDILKGTKMMYLATFLTLLVGTLIFRYL